MFLELELNKCELLLLNYEKALIIGWGGEKRINYSFNWFFLECFVFGKFWERVIFIFYKITTIYIYNNWFIFLLLFLKKIIKLERKKKEKNILKVPTNFFQIIKTANFSKISVVLNFRWNILLISPPPNICPLLIAIVAVLNWKNQK